jgi:hypothetical protein
MLNGIIDSRKVRAQKAMTSSQSSWGSSFIPRHLEDRLEIKMLKQSPQQRDEEMRRPDEVQGQRDDFYAQAFTQQHIVLQIS